MDGGFQVDASGIVQGLLLMLVAPLLVGMLLGNLAPRFAIVSNLAAKDGGKAIIAGNERVLRARSISTELHLDAALPPLPCMAPAPPTGSSSSPPNAGQPANRKSRSAPA